MSLSHSAAAAAAATVATAPQFLIFFQNLVKLPASAQKLTPKRKAVIESFIKKTEQQLEKIAPKGHRFLKSSLHVLHREENWIDWKDRSVGADRCPSLSVRLFLKNVNEAQNMKNYVDVEGGDTIASLKLKVADKLGVPVAQQQLVVNQVVLNDTKLVCDYPLPSKPVVTVQRDPQLAGERLPMRKRRQDASATQNAKRVRLGTDELTRLWNCGSTNVDGAPLSHPPPAIAAAPTSHCLALKLQLQLH